MAKNQSGKDEDPSIDSTDDLDDEPIPAKRDTRIFDRNPDKEKEEEKEEKKEDFEEDVFV